jgi:tryptophan 2,3-dioxygenase
MATPQPTSPPSGAPGPGGRPTSYWDYIRVEELLALQNGIARSDAELADDEVRFIVIHQIDELWFKLVLRELVTARNLFAQRPVPEDALAGAVNSLRRITICFELASQHFRLMETMQTQDYLRFRDKLNPASGFSPRRCGRSRCCSACPTQIALRSATKAATSMR